MTLLHRVDCRRAQGNCSCQVEAPFPHEIRRVRELAYRAGEAVPAGLESMTRPQIRVAIARLEPLERRAVQRARGVRV